MEGKGAKFGLQTNSPYINPIEPCPSKKGGSEADKRKQDRKTGLYRPSGRTGRKGAK